MSSPYSEIEDRITDTLQYIDTLETPNIAATARSFNVPENCLRHRYKSSVSRIDVGERNKKLSDV